MAQKKLHDLISDIHALVRELQRYEEKYGLLSADFYILYIEGRLRDEEIEEIDEFGRWAALYQMRQRREEMYESVKASLFDTQTLSTEVKLRPYTTPELV
jgi:hypothetical protein